MKISFKIVSLIFILFFEFNCNSNSQTAEKSKVGEYSYFPSQQSDLDVQIDDKMDDFRNKWYSEHLASMNEPILFNKTGNNLNVFRYTNLGTFSKPYSIRVELHDSIVIIYYKQTNGKGGYGAGRLIKDIQKQLSIKDWNNLNSQVKLTHFWTTPSFKIKVSSEYLEGTMDGSEWIFEGLIGEKYHFVTRNSPENTKDKDFASLCNFVYDLYLRKKNQRQ